MALVDRIAGVQSRAADTRRRLTAPEGTRCFLLARGVETGTLAAVRELTAGWQFRWSDFRAQSVLEFADAAAGADGFPDDLAACSFVGHGAPDSDGAFAVFSIDPERRDLDVVTVDNIFWKVYCTRDSALRYSVPEPDPGP